jgi:hypothetical protein
MATVTDTCRYATTSRHGARHSATQPAGLLEVGHVPFAEIPDSYAADIERFLATVA